MKIFLISLVVVVIGAAGALYFIQQQKISSLNDKVSSLEADVQSAKKDTPSDSPTKPDTTVSPSYESEKGVAVTVTAPTSGSKVSSPLQVTGEVPGSWSFEGQFGIRLLDAQGNKLAEAPATLQEGWMTDNPVPFTATLEFSAPSTKGGTLVIMKSNPSDLPENNDTVVVPVTFN